MKTIQEQIKVMQYFADDNGIIERTELGKDNWRICNSEIFNWDIYDYRIKEQKKAITIEKWLVQFDDDEYRIMQSSDIEKSSASKIKLLETYEVEL